MSQDQDSKTEQPTRKKLRDAKKKGQVARSEELVPLMMVVLAILYFWFAWDWLSARLTEYLSAAPAYIYEQDFVYAIRTSFDLWFKDVIMNIMLPFTALMLAAGIMGNVMQFGFLFSIDPIIPKPEKINPIAGFKRVFSMKQLIKTVFAVIKIIAMSIIITVVVRVAIVEYMQDIQQCDFNCKFNVFTGLAKKMMMVLVPIFIIMVMLDLMYQKFQFTKEQRMTKDQVKRERKNQEGDPIIKSQRKAEQRRLLEQDIGEQVKYSRVIILGMRKAAALMFEKEMPLPILLVIGRDRLCNKMIEIAKKENVPIISDPILVNLLEADGVIDQYIPASAIKRAARAMRG